MVEVLYLDNFGEESHVTVPFSTLSIKILCFGWLSRKSGRMCVGYEAEMAALSLACCSPGSEVAAAWKSAEWCWANSFISTAKVF